MKIIKLLFTGLSVVFLQTTTFSQDNEPVNLSIIPPSPNALSFMKFGDIEVSPYTGIPKIDIPLYEYTGKYIRLPVSLMYHAGGIRVEEIAPSVGLGWALIAGGSVSRTVRGLADDMATYGYLYAGEMQNCTEVLTPFSPESKCYNYFIGSEDSEQDIFHVNVNNLSFNFTISKDGTYELDPQSRIKVEKVTGNLDYGSYGNIIEWIITDESGIRYIFNKKEFSKSTSSSNFFLPHPSNYVVTSWYLTQIVAPFYFETVNIEYDQYNYSYSLNMSETINNNGIHIETYSGIQMIAQRIKKISTPDSTTILFNYDNNGYRCDLKGDRVLTKISISSPDKEIRTYDLSYKYMLSGGFETYSTCTLGGEHQLGKRLVLSEVLESGKNPYQLTYKAGLPSRNSKSQDHWGFYNGKANTTLLPKTYYSSECFSDFGIREFGDADRRPDTGFVKCGTLTKIVYPTGGSTTFKYELNEANDRFLEYSLVNKNYMLDGFANSSKEITINREQLPYTVMTFNLEDLPESFGGNCVLRALIKDDAVTLYAVDFTKSDYQYGNRIQEIKAYLDDGNYVFTFEILNGNNCSINDPFILKLKYENEASDDNKNAGGIRIKKIIDKPDPLDDNNEIIRWYEYNYLDGSSSGYILHHPVYLTLSDWHGLSCFFGSLTSSSRAFLGNTQGSPVGYSRVIEHFGPESENGFIEYWYTSPKDYRDFYGYSHVSKFPYPPPSSLENCRGLLTKKLIWDKDSSIVEKSINSYNINRKFGDGLTNVKVGNDESWEGEGYILIGQSYLNYQIKANLDTNVTVSYFSTSDSIVTLTTYEYNNDYYQLSTKKTNPLSDGTYMVDKYYYPQDFSRGTSDAIDTLFNGNNFSEPLIKESWKGTDENNLSLISTTVNVYKDSEGGKAFLDEVYSLKSDRPLTKSEVLEFDPDIILRKPEYYQRDLKIIKCDNRDNILEYLKNDGTPVSFFWGYSTIYPVASFKNMSYSVIETNTNGLKTELEKLDDYTVMNEPSIRMQLKALNDLIRSKTPPGARVTTYTYDPVVGLTSHTDPNGVTTYYEYDDFGRLESIKDDDGRIIKTYEYHYKE